MSFRSQLWSLERATPNYGADSYAAYSDDAYDDDLADDHLGDDHTGAAEVHALDAHRRSAAGPVTAPGLIGAVVRAASDSASAGVASAPVAAVMRRRALAYRRRRQVLATLVAITAVCSAPAVVLGGPWVGAEAVASTLLVAYLGLLIRRGRHEAERVQKVRYLTPIRAPRPSVVVIGSGAAR
jgi:hypothetical protein